MPSSRDPRIDRYFERAPAFARPILAHCRELVHAACPGVTETIKWNMPFFEYGGSILCFMAAFKSHAGFGFWRREMRDVVGSDGAKAEEAMGNFGRLTTPADLPSDATMRRHIKHAARLNERGPGRPGAAAKARARLVVPRDLAAALRKNPAAAEHFRNFSYSHRKEYIAWITEAKRAETREKRLATAIGWLAAGKARYWRHE